MKRLLSYIKHFLIVSVMLGITGIIILVSQKGSIGLAADDLAFKVGNEGPHVFLRDDQYSALYIRGGRDEGFYVETNHFDQNTHIPLSVYFPLDESQFKVTVQPKSTSPQTVYSDTQPIIAISDLEGNFKTFRDFLITHNVINRDLNWVFGKGHLVLVGDMVDRGFSTTQLLWLIYKLDHEATLAGGKVHYIIGNHEIKNMQGNFKSAANKYLPIAGILGKQQYELFGKDAVLGQWLESKNVVEKINGVLFTHGGIHPMINELDIDLETINTLVRSHYRKYYYPNRTMTSAEDLLTSTKTGVAWYRGYFNESLLQQEIDTTLNKFDAKAVVVGHTLQFKVNTQFNDKVVGIDVKHPDDYNISLPFKRSEGLLIENGKMFRILDDGSKVNLSN